MVSISMIVCSNAARRWCSGLCLVIILLMTASLMGQEKETPSGVRFDESFEMWPVDLKINGSVILAGSKVLPEGTKDYFLTMAKRRLNQRESDQELPFIVHLSVGGPSGNEKAEIVDWPDGYQVPHDQLPLPAGSKQLWAAADGLWLTAGGPLTERGVARLVDVSPQLHEFIGTGGILFADSQIAPWLGELKLLLGKRLPSVQEGLNLIPDCVVMTEFQPLAEPQVLSLLSVSPRTVGIGIPAGSLLVLNGRKIRVYGEQPGTMLLAANREEPVKRKEVQVSPLGRRRLNPYRQMADLTAWRRHAIDRTSDVFPPAEPPTPYVAEGALVIVGGGGMPEGLMDQFIELAGGPTARLVYIPCAEQDQVPESGLLKMWREKGVASAVQMHTKDRKRANTDPEFLAMLRDATGIWFGGGRQWNFSDSYYGTEAHRLMKQVVQRGGVVGGSSAGASIQARYLARANPLGNFDIMVDGYERGGLGFIGGVAIDQHFSQRQRQPDMSSLVDRYPQLLGIGLDEKTAIIVRKSIAEVVGEGKAHFYDRNRPVVPGKPDFLALEQGAKFDLAEREEMTEDPVPLSEDK